MSLTDWLDNIYLALDHPDFFGHIDGFKRSGSGYIARCPSGTHTDRHPSFYMPSGRPYGLCFACGHRVTWWQALEARGLRGWQVVEELARMAGVAPPPRTRSGSGGTGEGEVEPKDTTHDIEDWWEARRRALWGPEGSDVLAYLRGRGYSDDLLRRMDVGARPMSETDVPAGVKLPGGPEYRLLIPFRTRGGRIVALAGRRIDTGEPKYMYPRGVGRTLVGWHTLRGRDAVPVVVEGLLDAVALEAAGIPGVIALGGAQGSGGQIEALRQFSRVVLAMDRDDAGRKGTERLIRALVKAGVKTYVAEWSGAKDPDELFRTQGVEAVQEAITKATTGHKWLIRRLAPAPGVTDMERDRALEAALDFTEGLARRSPAAAQEAVQEMATVFGLGVEVLSGEIERLARKRAEEEEKRRWQEVLTAAQKAAAAGKIDEAREVIEGLKRPAVTLAPPPSSLTTLIHALASVKDGLDTPWNVLNRLVQLDRGGLTVVGAATSVGKSTFLMNLFLHALRTHTGAVIFWSGEVSAPLLVARLLGILTNLSIKEIIMKLKERQNTGVIDPVMSAAEKELESLFGERVIILDASQNIQELSDICYAISQNIEISCVFIDYLQQMPPVGKYGTREQEVTAIARGLHELARNLNTPVVAAAQLSRNNFKYAERPNLTDLRESGGIEQYATNVLGLWNASMARGAEAFSGGATPAAPAGGWYWTPRDKDTEEAKAAMAMAASWGQTLLEVAILKSRWHGNTGKTVPLMLAGASGVIREMPDVSGGVLDELTRDEKEVLIINGKRGKGGKLL